MKIVLIKLYTYIKRLLALINGNIIYILIKSGLYKVQTKQINLCGGSKKINGFYNIDLNINADLCIDLEKLLLPFADNSVKIIVCISAINYFTKKRGQEIIKDVYRVLETGGIARFAVQDLHSIMEKYINNDQNFFYQKLPNGKERFLGTTMADKINSWFYDYKAYSKGPKYFYDYETLRQIFDTVGFKEVKRMGYRKSNIANIEEIDNREDQMFFLEAIK